MTEHIIPEAREVMEARLRKEWSDIFQAYDANEEELKSQGSSAEPLRGPFYSNTPEAKFAWVVSFKRQEPVAYVNANTGGVFLLDQKTETLQHLHGGASDIQIVLIDIAKTLGLKPIDKGGNQSEIPKPVSQRETTPEEWAKAQKTLDLIEALKGTDAGDKLGFND